MKFCKKCGKQIHTTSDFCKECRTPPPRMCACGCGGIVTSTRREVRFLPGHSNKSEEIKQKQKQTILARYGVDNASKSSEIKKKKEDKALARYGVKCVFQSEEIKEKSKQTCFRNFGVENARQAEEIKEKARKTCLERYGVDYITQSEYQKHKSRETCLERYGVVNVSQTQIVKDKVKKTMIERFGMWNSQTEESKEKTRKTCLERYGTEWYVQTEIQKQKSRETCLKRYGVEYSSSAPEVKEIKRLACQEKYGVNNVLQLEEVREKIYKTQRKLSWNRIQQNTDWIPQFSKEEFIEKGWFDKTTGKHILWKFKCTKCDKISEIDYLYRSCPHCTHKTRSKAEIQLYEWVKQLIPDTEVISNAKRIIDDSNKELDIYIPSKNLAIEYDGLYWHSCKYDKDGRNLINKTILCEKKNIQLIHVFEDLWNNNPEKVKSLISNKLGIYDQIIKSEDCQLTFLNGSEYCDFIVNNSIKEDVECAYCVGIIFQDELIATMLFKTSKYQDEYEISDICYKCNTYIDNGSRMMLDFFLNHIYAKKITSCVDRCLYKGTEFLDLGFKLSKYIAPRKYTIDGSNRSDGIINTEDDSSDNIIYDCGSLLYEWINPNQEFFYTID